MENSSIQPREVLTDYASKGAEVKALSAEAFDALCDAVVEHLFSSRPEPHTVAPGFAQIFREAAGRDPALAKDLAAVKVAVFTQPGGAHYDEACEEYLMALSKTMYTCQAYRETFDIVAQAMRDGTLAPTEVPTSGN